MNKFVMLALVFVLSTGFFAWQLQGAEQQNDQAQQTNEVLAQLSAEIASLKNTIDNMSALDCHASTVSSTGSGMTESFREVLQQELQNALAEVEHDQRVAHRPKSPKRDIDPARQQEATETASAIVSNAIAAGGASREEMAQLHAVLPHLDEETKNEYRSRIAKAVNNNEISADKVRDMLF